MNKNSLLVFVIAGILVTGSMAFSFFSANGQNTLDTTLDNQQLAEVIAKLDQSVRNLEVAVNTLQFRFDSMPAQSRALSASPEQPVSKTPPAISRNATQRGAYDSKHKETAITPEQQITYETIRDRIRNGDGSLTIHELMSSEEVKSLPQPLVQKVLGEITTMLNSGQLDEHTFLNKTPDNN